MNEDLSQQLREAEKQLKIYQDALVKSQDALKWWESNDSHRSGGSDRQDEINASIGDDYKKDVSEAQSKVDMQQALVTRLKEQLHL